MANKTFRNRILEYGVKPADQFLAHPKNARLHPTFQRDAMKAALDTVGFVAPVLEAASGYLVDGHERVWAALQNDNADVPYVKLDISEDEENFVLATFDPLTSLANYDAELLDSLLREVNSDSEAIQMMLSHLAADVGMYVDPLTWGDAAANIPDGDRAPFQQMTFTLHDNQVDTVKRAITTIKRENELDTSDNENSNGNALAAICEAYLNGRS